MLQLLSLSSVNPLFTKAVTILIRIEIGSILREILPDPTIIGYLNKHYFYKNKIYLNTTSIY
jgi:hypothetical protein